MVPVTSEPVLISVPIEARLIRQERRRLCRSCRHKRNLVSVGIVSADGLIGLSNPKCLECWGVRDHGAA